MEPIYMLLADIHSIGNPLKIRFTVGYKYGQRRLNFIPAKMKNTKVGNDLPITKTPYYTSQPSFLLSNPHLRPAKLPYISENFIRHWLLN